MKSIGQILYSQRKQKKWSLEDVSKFTKIHTKYLKALEDSNLEVFNDRVHAVGFLKNYAEFLELDVPQMVALWRREFGGDFTRGDSLKPLAKVRAPHAVFTPFNLVTGLLLIMLFLFFSYIFFQYKSYSDLPAIEIYSPTSEFVTSKDILDVRGKVTNGLEITLNGQSIPLSQDGVFATTIKLNSGINVLSFSAKNDLNKESVVTRTVILRYSDWQNVVNETSESSSVT